MKLIITLLIVGMFGVTGRADTDAVLCGIRYVETRDQPHPPRGKLGERGPYQFRRSTWRIHTSSSFNLAENREVAHTVAKRHYAWIQAQLRANGLNPSPYNVALAWNAGVNAVIRDSAPAMAHDYATRVLNIAGTLPDRTPTPPTPSWRAPVLLVEGNMPSSSPETPVAPASVSSPVPVESATQLVSTGAPDPHDPVMVRYHSDPILLAFNRNHAQEPISATPVAESGATANALVVAGIIPPASATGHLPVLALFQNLSPGAGIAPMRL